MAAGDGRHAAGRTALLLALVLAGLLLAAPAATAHDGGSLLVQAADGGYQVSAFATRTPDAVHITAYPVRRDLGEPDARSAVWVTVDDGARSSRVPARRSGGGYEAVFPGARGSWVDWDVAVDVAGPAGRASVGVTRAGAGSGDLPAGRIAAILALVLLAGVLASFPLRRRAVAATQTAP